MTTPANNPLGPETIEAYLLGQLSEGQVQALDHRLRTDPQALRQLSDAIQVMSLVRQEFSSQAQYRAANLKEPLLQDFNTLLKELGELEDSATPIAIPVAGDLARKPGNAALSAHDLAAAGSYLLRHSLTPKAIAIMTTAAALLLGVVLTIVFLTGGPDDTPSIVGTPEQSGPTDVVVDRKSVVATLTAEHDAVWERRPGEDLYAGQRFTLTGGFAEVTTRNGAVVIIEAPASIELLDHPNAIRLHDGRLVGLCHTPLSKGFVVKTAYADVTDLGTEFGVEVSPNSVTTTVFIGEVELKTPGGEPRSITTNQTASLHVEGDQLQLLVVDRLTDGFTRRLPRAALITAAYINLEGFEVEIVPQGVAEDARIRTDRRHEMNGLDEQGIPSALLGGDLVLTPADAKQGRSAVVTEQLRIELELAQPSTVYLLIPSNSELPQWLTEQYVPTAMRVGFDMGETSAGQTNTRRIGVGPGESIDDEMVVWRRKQTEVGRVVVGGHMINAMYGIVVVPAEERGTDLN